VGSVQPARKNLAWQVEAKERQKTYFPFIIFHFSFIVAFRLNNFSSALSSVDLTAGSKMRNGKWKMENESVLPLAEGPSFLLGEHRKIVKRQL
jgi:hypothetical protein